MYYRTNALIIAPIKAPIPWARLVKIPSANNPARPLLNKPIIEVKNREADLISKVTIIKATAVPITPIIKVIIPATFQQLCSVASGLKRR